jgi:hypothetical protein
MPEQKNKLLVEVDLVDIMVPIIAEPGDKLMMLNGVCIGVNTARPAVLKLAPPDQKKVNRGGHQSKVPSTLPKHKHLTREKIALVRSAVLEAVTKNEQMTIPELLPIAKALVPEIGYSRFATMVKRMVTHSKSLEQIGKGPGCRYKLPAKLKAA